MAVPARVDRFGPLPPTPRLQVPPRQSQILDLIAIGLADKEIAQRLGLSKRTVRTHIERFFASYGLHDRAGAAALWVRMNISG
ncbi:MAG TPA: helix-turn-helix transcriptional regulator [Candidatus Dormibacteraeota bacterium]